MINRSMEDRLKRLERNTSIIATLTFLIIAVLISYLGLIFWVPKEEVKPSTIILDENDLYYFIG